MVTMTFELHEAWRRGVDHGKYQARYDGEALFWTSPSLEKPTMAAHVYESLGRWEWYVFGPTGHQADEQGKEPTEAGAKEAARRALYDMASPRRQAAPDPDGQGLVAGSRR